MHDRNVQEFIDRRNKDREIIVYCHHGSGSLGAVAYFLEKRFRNVAGARPGFETWRQVYQCEEE